MQGVGGPYALTAPSWTCAPRHCHSRKSMRCLADTKGVEALLQKDRNRNEDTITAEWEDEAADSPLGAAPVAQGAALQALSLLVQSPDAEPSASSATDAAAPKHRLSKEAISAGLQAYQASRFEEAISLFTQALELPGSGCYRLSGTVREISCPSDGEEQAALYNMACAYAQLRRSESALTCLEAVLENGFDDMRGLRSDPDLQPIHGAAFDSLMSKYDGLLARVLRPKSKKSTEESPDMPTWMKPW